MHDQGLRQERHQYWTGSYDVRCSRCLLVHSVLDGSRRRVQRAHRFAVLRVAMPDLAMHRRNVS
ncbi:MAG: hypothetical protein ACYCO9_20070 [Streptosporangiaceae bacterium]